MLDDILKTAEHKMKKTVEVLQSDLSSIRTGRATPALLNHITVDYYGTATPVNGVGNISAPDPRTVVVQPWDRNMLGVIEKAIQKSDLGINPTNDGQVIRLTLPQLTEDRRRDLVKQVHHRAEEARVSVRNVRREAVDQIKKLDRDGQVSEEDARRAQDKVQKHTDQYVKQVDEVSRKKESEVMEV